MKKTFIYMMMAVAAVGFTACETDDTDFSEIIDGTSSDEDDSDDSSGSDDSGSTDDSSSSTSTDLTITQSTSISKAVEVNWSSSAAEITVASDIYSYLTFAGSGSQVKITSNSSLTDEITYTLSGSSSKGSFYLDGSTDATVVLNSLTLTCADSAAVNIENGKRINVDVEGTNTLKDGASSTGKGALMINGHSQFTGSGTLKLYGYTSNGFWADEYIQLKQSFTGSLIVTYAAGDGINVNQFMEVNGGTVKISGVLGDGIQINADDKYVGYFNVDGGTIDISTTAAANKSIKAEGYIHIDDDKSTPTITITNSGTGEYDSDDKEVKGAACMSSDSNVTIDAGTITLTASGNGGKGLKCDSLFTMNGGTLVISTSGTAYTSNGDSTYPKGLRAGTAASTTNGTAVGGIVINDGTIDITLSGQGEGAEGMESKNTIYINGGTVNIDSYDDCINSAKDLHLAGGTVTVMASNNDGIDSNGDLYVEGGTIIALGASAPENGIDAAEGYNIYFNGGSILAAGGSGITPSSSSSQAYISTSGTVSAGSTITLSDGSNTLASFTIPSSYAGQTSTSGGAPNGGGGPGSGGGSASGSIIISCAGISSGSSYTLTNGSSTSTVTSQTSSSSSTGGGGNQGGPNGK